MVMVFCSVSVFLFCSFSFLGLVHVLYINYPISSEDEMDS